MMRTAVLVLGLLFLAGCGSVPRPFEDRAKQSDRPLLELRNMGIVHVERIEGTTIPLGEMIADGLVREFADRNIAATANPVSTPALILKGVAGRVPGAPQQGHILTLQWSLENADGTALGSVSQRVSGRMEQWLYGDNQFIDQLTREATAQLSGFIVETQDVIEAERDARLTVYVGQVMNAPGSGNRELREAMILSLRQAGARIGQSPKSAAFVVAADVAVGPVLENQQNIEIVWGVQVPEGEVIGRARQRNRVPAGSLEGIWGPLAFDVARAALDGIAGVIDRHEAQKEGRKQRLDVPESFDLRRTPGRAPPPPS